MQTKTFTMQLLDTREAQIDELLAERDKTILARGDALATAFDLSNGATDEEREAAEAEAGELLNELDRINDELVCFFEDFWHRRKAS